MKHLSTIAPALPRILRQRIAGIQIYQARGRVTGSEKCCTIPVFYNYELQCRGAVIWYCTAMPKKRLYFILYFGSYSRFLLASVRLFCRHIPQYFNGNKRILAYSRC
jgi:hypothetical protein